jgi:hypothetical protein
MPRAVRDSHSEGIQYGTPHSANDGALNDDTSDLENQLLQGEDGPEMLDGFDLAFLKNAIAEADRSGINEEFDLQEYIKEREAARSPMSV